MSTYNPKRPVPSSTLNGDEPAPVEALLDAPSQPPTSPEPSAEPELTQPEATRPEPTPAPTVASSSKPAAPESTLQPEVPVAPAPNEGTANRAVLIAAAGLGVVGLLILVLLRRRGRS